MRTWNLTRAYVKNVFLAAVSDQHTLDTMVATYYVTSMCNFRCNYCEHFSADLNEFVKDKQVNTEKAKKILDILRKDCDVLYLTGGEPLLRNDIEEICEHGRKRDFAYMGMNTNGLLLPKREKVLDIGPVQATTEKHEMIPLSPIVGIAAVAGGIALVVAGSRTRV